MAHYPGGWVVYVRQGGRGWTISTSEAERLRGAQCVEG